MYMLFMTRKGCLLNIMFVYGIQMYTGINLACVTVCMYTGIMLACITICIYGTGIPVHVLV